MSTNASRNKCDSGVSKYKKAKRVIIELLSGILWIYKYSFKNNWFILNFATSTKVNDNFKHKN